jgi:hypothetical protein
MVTSTIHVLIISASEAPIVMLSLAGILVWRAAKTGGFEMVR